MKQISTGINKRRISDVARVNVSTTRSIDKPRIRPKPKLTTYEVNKPAVKLVARKVETSMSVRNSMARSNLNITSAGSTINIPPIISRVKISGSARIGNSARSVRMNPDVRVTSRTTSTSKKIARPCKGCSRLNRTPTIRG